MEHQIKKCRIYVEGKRIFLKHDKWEKPFFTNYEPDLFALLTCPHITNWTVMVSKREKGHSIRLNATIPHEGKSLMATFSGLVWAYFKLGMRCDNLVEKLKELREEYFENDYQIDHMRDNRRNNCINNLSMMYRGNNLAKHNRVTQIQLPYIFVPITRPEFTYELMQSDESEEDDFSLSSYEHYGSDVDFDDEEFEDEDFEDDELCDEIAEINLEAFYSKYFVIAGKMKQDGSDLEWVKKYRCDNESEFLKLLNDFTAYAKKQGDMLPPITDGVNTLCVSQMVNDDGVGAFEDMITASEDEFEFYRGGGFPPHTPK